MSGCKAKGGRTRLRFESRHDAEEYVADRELAQMAIPCRSCRGWHLTALRTSKSTDPAVRVEQLEAVLLHAWHATTAMVGRPVDQVDVENLRGILHVADENYELQVALDRLVRNE